MPKVSVVMPAYNAERYIADAIHSVLTQTLGDWELLIVDDGSTDATPSVVENIGDSRVIKTRQENQGAAAARNAALDIATGEFIGFLDADDLYLPNSLEDMVGFLTDHPTNGVVYSDGLMCDANKKVIMRLSDVRPGMYTGRILEHIVLSSSVITVPVCTLSRHTAIKKGGVRFDTRLTPSEDWDFWIQLARDAQFAYLDRLTCMYRIHETNITKTSGLQHRRTDLVQNRLKVMNADWFPELSKDTQRQFFYNLLVGLLANDPEQQETIMTTPAFRGLPSDIQADSLRFVAGNYLSQRQNTEFAVQCLRRSMALQPDSRKGRLLLGIASQSPSLATAALSTWRVAYNLQTRIRSFGRRRPKPVPAMLLSTVD
jgi:glycosyltransferase involved in cell wall biosynthesis